jgi:predicted aspartyl protease
MRIAMMFTALLALAAGTAHAECAKPLSLVTSIDMTPVKETRAILVPVTLNGKQKQFLVDTGGAMTEMSPDVADELALPRQTTAIQLFDVSGRMSNQYVHADFGIGTLNAKDMVLMLSPAGQDFEGTPIAGLLAPDILKHYDVDIDFGSGKFNLISQDHCDGKVIYWQADAVAVVPMKVMASGHILLPVLVNGKEVTALLDTGAWNTTLSQAVAEQLFGLKMGSPDTPATGTLATRSAASTYHHVFDTLGFEGIAVSHTDIDIIPDFGKQIERENATPETGSHLAGRRTDETQEAMLLGMNILRHFHIYIAYKEDRVYITPATPPASVAPAAATPTAPTTASH